VNTQLFVPQSWISDDERRKRTHVPAQISEQPTPEIALGLLDQTQQWGLAIQAVVVEAGYGDHPHLLAGLEERQVPYVCAVQSTFGVRLPQEVPAARQSGTRLLRARTTTPASSSSPLHGQGTHRGQALVRLADDRVARGNHRHDASSGGCHPRALGHRLSPPEYQSQPPPHGSRRVVAR
jgi:hypothetical protein